MKANERRHFEVTQAHAPYRPRPDPDVRSAHHPRPDRRQVVAARHLRPRRRHPPLQRAEARDRRDQPTHAHAHAARLEREGLVTRTVSPSSRPGSTTSSPSSAPPCSTRSRSSSRGPANTATRSSRHAPRTTPVPSPTNACVRGALNHHVEAAHTVGIQRGPDKERRSRATGEDVSRSRWAPGRADPARSGRGPVWPTPSRRLPVDPGRRPSLP